MISPLPFEALAARSRELHGHKYVLPVAAWVQRSEEEVVTVGEVLIGLHGRADRTRVIEALERLAMFGPLTELPRAGQLNAPRYFQRQTHPYWDLVEAYLVEVENPSP
jgi:hypothetical protein